MKKLIFILFILISLGSFATHYRAGEISYKHVSGFTYAISVVTYTKASSTDADSDTITVKWGDGSNATLYRQETIDINQSDLRINIFKMEHTYSGPSTYTISIEDQNRNGGVVNIPESDQISFYVESTLTISPQEFGVNNSPILTYPPIDIAAIDQIFIHNTGAYDIDGDSLGYELVNPKGFNGLDIPAYELPDQFPADQNNQLELDPITGDIIWKTPQSIGQYNIAIKITEYRNGIIIGTMMRDMQVTVVSTSNKAPDIRPLKDSCYIAGSIIEEEVRATDDTYPDDPLSLYASGGPFEVETSPATIEDITAPFSSTLTAGFTWNSGCYHIRKSFYAANFKAKDYHIRPLVDIETWLINITAPAPENLAANTEGRSIILNWDEEYDCDSEDHFQGYIIWRKEGTTEIINSTCEVDLRQYGYQELSKTDSTTFYDSSAEYGRVYCYRVQAIFRNGTSAFPYNEVYSIPSDPICSNLSINLPIPINVDIIANAIDTGKIFVRWIKPALSDFDTVANSGLYRYDLYRSSDSLFNNPTLVHTFQSTHFDTSIDTSYIDTLLNTNAIQYYYRISFSSNNNFLDYGPSASSISLSSIGTDQEVKLNWAFNTPWHEYSYNIYRKAFSEEGYQLIGHTDSLSYSDTNVINERNYRYYIQSVGSYIISDIDSLVNHSNITEVVPVDSVPPPAPELNVENACEYNSSSTWSNNQFYNILTWNNPEGQKDIIGYDIYQKNLRSDSLALVLTINDPTILSYKFDSLFSSVAACYAIIAFDSNSTNYSDLSNTECVDNCPVYELPNVFTPNNDGINDLYIPISDIRFIESIDFKVYNRWGDLVYQTEDKNIAWNGFTIDNNKALGEGVYFYTCVVYERRIDGIMENTEHLSGYINIFR